MLNIGKRCGMLLSRGTAAVDDGAAERRAVAAHELGQRMHDDVGAVFDRPQQDRRRDRVVDDQRHAVPVRDVGQAPRCRRRCRRDCRRSRRTRRVVLSSISFSMASG